MKGHDEDQEVDPEEFLQVYEREYETTLRALRAFPQDKLGFRPHPKWMTLGQLGFHVAEIEAWAVGYVEAGRFQVSGGRSEHHVPSSMPEVLGTLEGGHSERMAARRIAIRRR